MEKITRSLPRKQAFPSFVSALLVPDTHIPYEDIRAVNLMLSIAESIKSYLQEIVLIGDFAECSSVGQWAKKPDKQNLLIREIECVNKWLDKIDKKFPKQKKVFIEGNHEDRLSRYFMIKAPELFGVTDCSKLFKINERSNWHWRPYGPRQSYSILGSRLYGRHEPFSQNLRTTASRAGSDLIFGHVHNFEEASQATIDDQVFSATCCGFLGNLQDQIFDYAKNKNWELGFILVHMNPKTKNYWIEKVRIKSDYTAYALGKVFQG